MFLLVSVRHVGAHPGGHQHGVSIQISINLGKTFLRISRIRNIPLTWILARVFAYLPPFISQILDFIYWTVLIFILIYFEWRDTENQQYIERETQCFITRSNTEKRVRSVTRSGVFLTNFGEFHWWWNIVSNAWYCLSKKMILEEEIKDFTSISKHLLNSNFLCIFFMNY